MRTSRSRTAPRRPAISRSSRRWRLVRPGRKPSPKTRHAARMRRVATRIECSSSGSLPFRVPASRASIRARWKRRTLRPASATVSSPTTPAFLPTTSGSGAATPGTAAAVDADPAGESAVAAASAASRGPSALRFGGRSSRFDRGRLNGCPRRTLLQLPGGLPSHRSAASRTEPSVSAGSGLLDRRHDRHGRRTSIAIARRAGLVVLGRGGQGRVQLRTRRRGESRIGAKERGELLEPGVVAVGELDLELDEAVDDPATRHDIDLVQAQLGGRVVALEAALAAELADRDELDERGVTAQLEHERAGGRGGPVARLGRPVGRTLELLAAGERALGRRRALDGDDRAAVRQPEAGGEAGPGEGPIGRVDVAVLVLGGPRPGGRPERPEDVGRKQPFSRGPVADAVLELDLHRSVDGHRKGASAVGSTVIGRSIRPAGRASRRPTSVGAASRGSPPRRGPAP